VTHLAADRDRLEKARLALLSQHHHIGEWLDQRDIPGGAGASPDVRAAEIANALRRVHTRTARAHQRAFTNREAS
jgi:hypothetical protein